jgi:ribosomal protein L35
VDKVGTQRSLNDLHVTKQRSTCDKKTIRKQHVVVGNERKRRKKMIP